MIDRILYINKKTAFSCLMEILIYSLTICTLFFKVDSLIDIYVLPKWLAGLFIVGITISLFVIGYGYLKRSSFTREEFIRCIGIVVVAQALWGWCKLYIIKDSIIMVGSFENPAGFASCLVIGLPFVLNICEKKYWKIISFIFIFISIILSQSRAGVLCCISILLAFEYSNMKSAFKSIIFRFILLITVSVISVWGLSCFKQGSSLGRMFIVERCIDIIKEHPLGLGTRGFSTNYMKYQEKYFSKHPDSPAVMVADDIKVPFNEYLYIMINYGILGMFLFIGLIVGIFRFCYKKGGAYKKTFILSFVQILIFSLFSYPLQYPFTWLILFSILLHLYLPFVVKIINKSFLVSVMGVLGGVCLVVYASMNYIEERKWARLYDESSYIQPKNLEPLYESIYKEKKSDPFFLYKYATILLDVNNNGRCKEVLNTRQMYIYDYSQAILWAQYFTKQNNYLLAGDFYTSASNMCPSKFYPLYKLYMIHKRLKNTNEQRKLRKRILNKKIKIDSKEVRLLRNAILNDTISLN